MTCNHQCTSNCRRQGCNCECGEWHCSPDEKCIYKDDKEAPCPNHPTMYERIKSDLRLQDDGTDRNIVLVNPNKLSKVLEDLEKKIEELKPKDRDGQNHAKPGVTTTEIHYPTTHSSDAVRNQAIDECIEVTKKNTDQEGDINSIDLIQALEALKK